MERGEIRRLPDRIPRVPLRCTRATLT